MKRKTKACGGTAQLIYTFVFAYAKSRFSHDEAHIILCELIYIDSMDPIFNAEKVHAVDGDIKCMIEY